MDKELKEVIKFLKSKIPMYYDLSISDIVYDEYNIYYKCYKVLYELREENKKLRKRVKS